MAKTINIPHTDKLGSILLIAIAIAVYVLSMGLPTGQNSGDPGPAFFPRLIAVCIGLLAFVQLIKLTISGKEVNHEISRETVLRVSAVIAVLSAYVLLLPILGFLICSFIFLVVLFRYSGETNILLIISVSSGLPFGLFLIFSGIFNIPLPESAILPVLQVPWDFVTGTDPQVTRYA